MYFYNILKEAHCEICSHIKIYTEFLMNFPLERLGLLLYEVEIRFVQSGREY